MALAALLAVGMVGVFPAVAAHADPVNPEKLHIDPYLVTAKYRGIAVDIKVLDEAVVDATAVRVTVHREVGPDVVKASNGDSVVTTLNSGHAVTAPIVIQQGSYDEAGSSSWVKPDSVWTNETVPTSITVEVLEDDVVVLARTVDAPASGPSGATLSDVLPALPVFTNPVATYKNGSDYAGIAVDIRVSGFTDAEQIIVRVDRENGSPVVKTSRPGAAGQINTGAAKSITAPIVIRPGTYNEAGSGTWFVPGAVWTSNTTPTSVKLTITRSYGPDVVTTLPLKGSISGVMPEASAPVEITVPSDQPGGQPFEVNVPEGVTDATLDLGNAIGGTLTVPVQVNVQSAVGANLMIPEGTQVTAADPSWDGVIQLPTVREDAVVPTSPSGRKATVEFAIEVGSDTTRLTFDAPVKLVLVGQAGGKAGFIQGGSFTEIDGACPADPTSLTTGACWLDDGDDLVIWTTHFTTFVAYTLSAASGGGQGPGNGGGQLAATGASDIAPLLGATGILGLLGAGLMLAGRTRRRDAR